MPQSIQDEQNENGDNEVFEEYNEEYTPPPTFMPNPAADLPEFEPPKKKVTRNSGMADLFEVPKSTDADINVDDLLEVDMEDVMGGSEDMSDLVDVGDDLFTADGKKSSKKKPANFPGSPPPEDEGLPRYRLSSPVRRFTLPPRNIPPNLRGM